MPKYTECPMRFLQQIIMGQKKLLKRDKISNDFVPKYRELSVTSLLE